MPLVAAAHRYVGPSFASVTRRRKLAVHAPDLNLYARFTKPLFTASYTARAPRR
jgi:hypothetical protein